ncbi:MAG: excinuclease ABC subunit UvrA, partial [Oscillospiraceae bacterium]|nr:excinuclease ABC subunit UvrA [Oscillospiraceae bacterium]
MIEQQTVDQICDRILALSEGTKFQILAPVVRGRKGEHEKVFESAKKSGYVRARVDGNIYDLSEDIKLEKNKKHNIEIIIDRLVIKEGIETRLTDSIETASNLSNGIILVDVIGGEELMFSQNYACDDCGISIEELTPRMFSFNNPHGACPDCTGLGTHLKVDPDMIIPDKTKSILEGAIHASGWTNAAPGTICRMYYDGLAKHYGFDLATPIGEIPEKAYNALLYGTGGEKIPLHYDKSYGQGNYTQAWEGLVANLERRYHETASEYSKAEIEECMISTPCATCGGKRLRREALAVTVGDINIAQLCDMSVNDALDFVNGLDDKLSEREKKIAELIIKEIKARLGFLKSVGLSYLTLSRSAGTLSGGESQRIRLATQIGASLMGVLYILDEPSIGLHQRDNDKLLATLRQLRDIGNTLIVVEHDEDTMRAADFIVDVGPGAGVHGGEIVAAGTIEDIIAEKRSITGQYLSGTKKIPVPTERRKGTGKSLKIIGASENNLKNIDVSIPLGKFTCITGVSGSGKSSLTNEILYKHLAAELNGAKTHPGKFKKIDGMEHLDKIIDIDQSPIGRTPRSNPATYTGVFNDIRTLFAMSPDAKMRGYTSSRFSFNVKGGRCEACAGDGVNKIEMHFLPDIYVTCDVCHGKRYNRETLEVKYKGKNIFEVLDMTCEEACEFFKNVPKIARKMQTLCDVGLGYIKLGQSSTTLS